MRFVALVLAPFSACAPAEVDLDEGRPDASWLGVARARPDEGASSRIASFDYARFALDPNALPASVDWRSVTGRSFVTGVRNQGPHSTCVAFSGAAAVESALAVQADRGDLDLAEQWLVATCGTVDPVLGYFPQQVGQDIVVHGIVDEARSPYVGDAAACPSGVVADASDAIGAAWLAVGSQVKAALVASPLIVELDVYDDFFDYEGGIYRVSDTATLAGGHSVLLVGYDDAEQAWIAKNSWGTGWGEDGFFRIAYDDARAGFGAYGVLLEAADGDPTRGARLLTDAGTDDDGDGWFAFEDCDDSRSDIHPGLSDACDGLDQDCDGDVDEDCADTADAVDTADTDDVGHPDDGGPALHAPTSDAPVVATSVNCATSGAPGGVALAVGVALTLVRRRVKRHNACS